MSVIAIILISLLECAVLAKTSSSPNSDEKTKGAAIGLQSFPVNAGCPAGFLYSSDGSKCYKPIVEAMTWDEARSKCLAQAPGAQLLTVTDAGTNTAAIKIIEYLAVTNEEGYKNICHGFFWTAGRQLIDDCNAQFVWQPSPGVIIPVTYTNWQWSQPDCARFGNEHCIHYTYIGTRSWNDNLCSWPMCAICEY